MNNKVLIAILAIILTTGCNKARRPVETHHTHISGYTDVAPTEQVQLENNLGDRVLFGFNRSNIDDEYRELLEKQAEWMKSEPSISIIIAGHADDRGTEEYNLALGERRAYAVKSYLMNLGISEDRMRTISYGKTRPAIEGTGEAVWRENRRAVITTNNN